MGRFKAWIGATLCSTAVAANMNGRYSVSSGSRQHVPFNDDFASRGNEYFDVWTPELSTRYSEVVYGEVFPTLPLPSHIVERFKDKIVVFTGVEHDQVMVQPQGQPGINPDADVSVPITWTYNHHFQFWVLGQNSEVQKVKAASGDPMAHGHDFKWVAVERELGQDQDRSQSSKRPKKDYPNAWFAEGNGGESRKSFRGFADGFGELVHSPTSWFFIPMQVDTANRDCGVNITDVDRCRHFRPGPEPKSARFARSGQREGSNYSALLECPCTSRYGGDPQFYPDTQTKLIQQQYAPRETGSCPAESLITNSSECFEAAERMGLLKRHDQRRVVDSAALPSGCMVQRLAKHTEVIYNNASSGALCGSGATVRGSWQSEDGVEVSVQLSTTNFLRSEKGLFCDVSREEVLMTFLAKPGSQESAYAAREACEQWCLQDESCWGCSAGCGSSFKPYGALDEACEWAAVTSCSAKAAWNGRIEGDISEKRVGSGTAQLSVTGPADVWFSVGFEGDAADESLGKAGYTILVNGTEITESLVHKRRLSRHCQSTRLKSSIQVMSDSTEAGRRTVTLSRPLEGLTQEHFSFQSAAGGGTEALLLKASQGGLQAEANSACHTTRHAASRMPLQHGMTASTCICKAGKVGLLCDAGGKNCRSFEKKCTKDLAAQHNPTCSSTSYIGGIRCCSNGTLLQDIDQPIPEQLLRYHIKLRFWFQEYTPASERGPASHINVAHYVLWTEGGSGEYDVPPAFVREGETLPGYPALKPGDMTPGTSCTGTCPDGPDCECVHTITNKVRFDNVTLVSAHGHCHGPLCLSLEMRRADTGETLCLQQPIYGQGNVNKDRFDEAGYLAVPPCLWGSPAEGLVEPIYLPPHTEILSIKKARNTHSGHTGEMSVWQMSGVPFEVHPTPSKSGAGEAWASWTPKRTSSKAKVAEGENNFV
mmetsp:Transcript_39533/g.93014  ORF Transcript_39533/g.93014 Transcript_39533/m.93014 type:complete len:936 (+) Transcript_39533:53-2860(+)